MSGEDRKPEDVHSFEQLDSDLPPLPDDDSFLDAPLSDFGDSRMNSDGSALLDKEMRRKLMDIESSFLPEPSIIPEAAPPAGADDTYLFGGSPGNIKPIAHIFANTDGPDAVGGGEPDAMGERSLLMSPATPADAYKTPGPGRSEPDGDVGHEKSDIQTSTSEAILPSSPAAAAAVRNMSRAASTAKPSTNDSHDRSQSISPGSNPPDSSRSSQSHRPASSASTVKGTDFSQLQQSSPFPAANRNMSLESTEAPPASPRPSDVASLRVSKRPSYLKHRQASQRSSLSSSFTSRSDVSGDNTGDLNIGADYALQSGGAVPTNSRQSLGLSRLPSLGSVASSASGYSDSNQWDRSRNVSSTSLGAALQGERNLGRLEEEILSPTSPPATPRAVSAAAMAPTDTVIAQHVQNIQVPDTIAKEYRMKHARSPEKRGAMASAFSSRTKHNLTLKEQNSKIDKLSKENFDLKLKIHFLDQALQNRSDEGVKDMIQKNVQLQTDLANEKKEVQNLRRKLRDLERNLKAQEEGQAAAKASSSGSDDEQSDGSNRQGELEEEITYLREVLMQTEKELETSRKKNLEKEVETRRLAEHIKSMGNRTSEGDSGVEEAMDMWRVLLETETARREQADEDAQKAREEAQQLQDELMRMKADAVSSSTSNHHVRNVYNITRRNHTHCTTRSQSRGSDFANDQNGSTAASSTLVEQLRHENAELRRDLGAQTSMLTSRNRERERLQQEIEDLKLNVRRGDGRSVAGDSIFERSISRAAHQRSASRASGATRVTQISDHEREEYESKQAELRDELARAKLDNQELERELNAHLDILNDTEAKLRTLDEEKELIMEDLQALQAERDDALLALQDKEVECENLREEALTTIERLEDEIEQKEREQHRLENELDARTEDFIALQQEMKVVSESLIQLEDDRDVSQRRILSLDQELDEANRELQDFEKRLAEAATKNERLEVQLESSQNEISFLREEQEGDKIKIGDLEAALNVAQQTIQEEKESFRDLEGRLAEERRQREILDSQEKEEVQKVLNELNMQASKAKEEVRKLRKNLSTKEVEATTWKQRLDELENSLREALGNLNGTKSSLLKEVQKLQRNLDSTVQELENTKHDLLEKDRILRNRDALLESTGLESRRLSDLLDKERQARKQDRVQYEQQLRTHQTVTRTVQQHETRVIELETARSQDRRKISQLEQQYKDQLLERNNLLLALWNRLSTLCGTEWAQRNSLVNGEVPSVDVIARNLPGFNKNIILAVKTVESIIGGFRSRIRGIEKDLLRDYQTLEHTLDVRVKRLDQLEQAIRTDRRSSPKGSSHWDSAEVTKLKHEVKVLKAELQFQRQTQTTATTTTTNSAGDVPAQAHRSPSASGKDSGRASVGATLLRHHSSSAVEALQQQSSTQTEKYQSAPLLPSEQRWMHRLRELERRLKAEREARLLDRSGARKRLEEGRAENEELRMLLEREKEAHRESLELSEGGSS